MALVTVNKLNAEPPVGYFNWIYEDTNGVVRRLEWGNTSTDHLVRLKLTNPAGKVLVDTLNMLPGSSDSRDIPVPDRFRWDDDGLAVSMAYGLIGG